MSQPSCFFGCHKWTEVSRTITPKAPGGTRFKNVDEEIMYDATFGFTTIELRCKDCGDLKHIKVSGQVKSA